MLKTSIAPSPPSLHEPPLHHRARGGNGQRGLKLTEQQSEQQRGKTKQRMPESGKPQPGLAEREIQKGGAREHERHERRPREVVLSSGYPPSPCLCFLHPGDSFMGLWLRDPCDPCVSCRFSAWPCHPPPPPAAHTGGSGVVGRA